jgi:hypothetical protein
MVLTLENRLCTERKIPRAVATSPELGGGSLPGENRSLTWGVCAALYEAS